MFIPRVTLPSLEGELTVIFGGPNDPSAHNIVGYDVNRDNILLLQCCWLALLADSPFDSVKPKQVIRRFVYKLYDLRQTIAEYATLGDTVMKSERIKEDGTLERDFIPAMTNTPIFREYYAWWRTGDTRALQYVLTFLKYGKKLSYVDDTLHTTALRKWWDVECRLRDLTLPPFVENLRRVSRWLFSDFKLNDIYPAHGGGAVSERGVRGVNAKNECVSFSAKTWRTYFGKTLFNCTETGDVGLPDFRGYCEHDAGTARSRLMFVPKDYKSARSICMEPIGMQFAQQGVLWYFEQYLKESKLAQFIELDRQESNQEAAQYGSYTGKIDTIDLSSASDSVSWKLMKYIMPSNLLRHLHATRSTEIELSRGLKISPEKFSPMGSALCFPTQCITFAATIITVAFCQSLGREWNDPNALADVDLDSLMQYSFGEFGACEGGKFEPLQVFGDDLCLDYRLTSNTIEALTAMGFTVNVDKSFIGSDTFRESCGKFYSRGHDVSFMLHSVKPLDEDRVGIETLGSVIDLANRAGDFHYWKLRSVLINFALRHKFPRVKQGRNSLNPILFSSDREENFAIYVEDGKAQNSHLRRRTWLPCQVPLTSSKVERKGALTFGQYSNVRVMRENTHVLYQRDEVQSITIEATQKVDWDIDYENYAYTVWWRSRRCQGDDLRFTQALARADRLGTTARYRWTGI